MGFAEDAKETTEAAAKKVGKTIEENVDRVKDKVDEVNANANVKRAETERASVEKRNEAKENLRDS